MEATRIMFNQLHSDDWSLISTGYCEIVFRVLCLNLVATYRCYLNWSRCLSTSVFCQVDICSACGLHAWVALLQVWFQSGASLIWFAAMKLLSRRVIFLHVFWSKIVSVRTGFFGAYIYDVMITWRVLLHVLFFSWQIIITQINMMVLR